MAHAARGLWAAGIAYSVAVFCPQYLVEEARHYLAKLGCIDFICLGGVVGAPNVVLIGDVTEVSHQGYEDLMRKTKVAMFHDPLPPLGGYQKVIVFPGKFEIEKLANALSDDAQISFDIAYDLDCLSYLEPFVGRLEAIIISTSSLLFMQRGHEDLESLLEEISLLSAKVFLLKENRGGSRLFHLLDGDVDEIPAVLSATVNSVGVGDAYSSVMVGFSNRGWSEAAWRGSQAATAYSQSTFPDDIKRDLQRGLKLSVDVLKSLGGTILPWHERQNYSIYLAAPDFSYVDKQELESAVSCLEYHNFRVRRPIIENGELSRPASEADLSVAYHADCRLLDDCDAVFAVPLGRDPGTLVEIGMAISAGKPVITYDPRGENKNTMLMVGSAVYSVSLDECLNGVFDAIANQIARFP